jgi:hypothetical protein
MMSTFMPAALSTIIIKTAELWELLRACGANNVYYYYASGALNDSSKTCGALRFIRSYRANDILGWLRRFFTISTKPAELEDFLRSCGANDVSCYPAVHPDCDKTCGAVRLTRSLRSWRGFLFFAPLRVDANFKIMSTCSVIVLMPAWYCNTLCWSRLQGKIVKTHARRLPRSPCSARRFHSIGSLFFYTLDL